MTTKDLLLIYPKIEADPVEAFCQGVVEAYKSITGAGGNMFYNMEIGVRKFPDHAIIHYRGSGPSLMRNLGEHQKRHQCVMINDETATNNGANKLTGIRLAAKVMRAPKTVEYSSLSKPPFAYPFMLKPVFSEGNSKGIQVIRSADDFRTAEKGSGYVFQEFIEWRYLIRAVYFAGAGLIDAVYDDKRCCGPETDYPISGYNKLREGYTKVYPAAKRAALAETCAKLANITKQRVMTVDFYETNENELVFGEINAAVNNFHCWRISGVKHAYLLAQYLAKAAK